MGHKRPKIIDALQQKNYDTTEITDLRCQEVYNQKLSAALKEVRAARKMVEMIRLQPAKTGNGKPNIAFYLEPRGKLVLDEIYRREIFDH